MDQNPSMVSVKLISLNNGPGAPSTSDLPKKERCSSTNDEESVAGSDSLDSTFNGSDSKRLEVQTKDYSNNDLPNKNAAIYSGLGLDISSSSSMEESPDGLGGLSPEFSNMPMPYESPRTILQVMTCFPVPGGFLMSPLSGNLLKLTDKDAPMLKKCETHLDMENVPRDFEGPSHSPLTPRPVRGQAANQVKPGSKKKKSVDTKFKNDKGDTSAIVNKEVNIEMPSRQEIIADMPAPSIEIKVENQFAHKKTRNTCMSSPSQQNGDVRLKEQVGANDLITVKTEVIKAEATKHTENSTFENSRTGILAPKGRPKIKMGKVHTDLEERDMSHHKSSSFDRKRKTKVKAEKKFKVAIVDFEYNENRNKEWGTGPCDDLRNVPVKETFSSNKSGDGNPRTEVKRMHKERHVTAAASYDLTEDDNSTHSSAADMDRENVTELKSCHFKKKSQFHKDLDETLPNRCQGDMEGGLLEDRSARGELRQKEEIMNTNDKNGFDVGPTRKEIPTSVKHGQLHMPSISGISTMNADPVSAHVMIKEHWVCCDICQKWRLLPYGTNPSMLPKKWKCSMLYWLPGMNRCDISEDETTDALNALYAIPAPATTLSSGIPQTAGAGAGTGTVTSSTYDLSGQFEQSMKRKNSPSDGNGLAYDTTPLMSNQQDPSRNKRTTDDLYYSFERDSVSKHGLQNSKEKKSNTLKSEEMASKADSRPGRVQLLQHADTVLPSSRGHLKSELANNKFVTGKESLSEQRETLPPKQDLDLAEPTGRDVAYPQSSTAATSSSSKISSSRRNKNSQEANDSPVKSVSSSPPRNFNIEKLSRARKYGTVVESLGNTNNSVRYQNNELRALDNGQHLLDRRATTLNSESGCVTHGSKNIEIRQGSGTVQRLGMSSKKEKYHLRIDNQDIRNPVTQVVSLPTKEGKRKVCPTSVKSDSLKIKAKLMRSNVENVVQHSTVKQVIYNPSDTGPMRKDGSMVAFALKEARDLKHKANDLKNKGQELESTGLYFQAALKFLHVAFLLETPSFDSSRPGDVVQSMKMYSETAKLCNFCAYEYERCKKMAAAALAYKCVEVAYLKAAYYKHPSASKDRQELQAAVQIAPGESPSSSASDIENLNSHGLSKASSTKGGNSTLVPVNNLPLAVHSQAHLLRLLAYTNDVNLAFDATRKSELVIASAVGSHERGEGVDDGLASVKTVLDLNFSNVKEILKLVRVSMESISS